MLPLLLGSRPQFSGKGPVVSLAKGRWEIFTDRVVSSKLKLMLIDGDLPTERELTKESIFIEGGRVQVVYITRGNEDYISVYARAA